mgnify:CR=1 FL=1
MCIRDSGERGQIISERRLFASPQSLEPRIAFEKAGECLLAVSYTHLRAHETVLDLVCRLLLEKKKRQAGEKHSAQKNTKHCKEASNITAQIISPQNAL